MSKLGKGGRDTKGPTPKTPQQSNSVGNFFLFVLRKAGILVGSSLRRSLQWPRENLTLKDGLIWASVIIGIFAGAFAFLPRITVEASGPYDPSSPIPITFVITNTNIIPLRDVQVSIGVCYLIFEGDLPDRKQCNGPATSGFTFLPWHTKWLDSDEKFSIALEEFIKLGANQRQQFSAANITIKVNYYPWRIWWFWKPLKEFRFVTKRLSDGKIYWTPTPLNR
jgi:hypothetical protein